MRQVPYISEATDQLGTNDLFVYKLARHKQGEYTSILDRFEALEKEKQLKMNDHIKYAKDKELEELTGRPFVKEFIRFIN